MVIVSLISVALALLAVVLTDYIYFRMAAGLIVLSLTVLFVYGHKYPAIFTNFVSIVKQARYKQSYLGNIDTEQKKQELVALMNQQKLYLEEDLSSSTLAMKLNISVHQLSQILNEHLHRNFFNFVNEYRIQDAKELLLADKKTSVLQIAYQVGFSSKASFNRAFKRLTRLTPQEFRKQQG